MDPNLTSTSPNPLQPQEPADLKTKITRSSNEFVMKNYEGFLRRLMGFFYSLFKFLKESIASMIGQLLGKD